MALPPLTPYTKFIKQRHPMSFRPYIANETQARNELARLKGIMLNLHTWKAEAQATGNETWAKIYSQRLSDIRPQVKEIVSYLNA